MKIKPPNGLIYPNQLLLMDAPKHNFYIQMHSKKLSSRMHYLLIKLGLLTTKYTDKICVT